MKKLFFSIQLFFFAFVANAQKFDSGEIIDGVLYINEGVEETGWAEYQNIYGLNAIVFPSTMKNVGYLSFDKNPGLTSVTIPGTIDTIKGWAFAECENLHKVVIEDGVKAINEAAFYKSNVDTFFVPSSVELLEGWVFSSDRTPVICCDYNSKAFDYAKNQKFHVCVLSIPEEQKQGLRAIEMDQACVADSFFFGMETLEYVRLTRSVKRLGKAAFVNTSVLHLDLPSGIQYIADDAIPDDVDCRCVAGSYAEQWLLDHDYHLKSMLSDLREYSRKPDLIPEYTVPDDVPIFNCNGGKGVHPILTKDQTVSDYANYNFKINRPVDVKKDGDSLVITSYYLRPLDLAALVAQSEQDKPLAFFAQIQPLTQFRVAIPNGAVGPFDVIANEEGYNNVRSIRMRDSITFGKVKNTEGDEYTWEPISPIQLREWIYMFTNMCYILSSKDFENKLYSHANKCYDDADGLELIDLEGLKDLYQRVLDKEHSELRRCGGGAWGLGHQPGWALGMTDWALMQHYESDNNYSAAYHEFSHNMGYHHDGNMTSGKKPIGKEEDPDEEFYGFEAAATSTLRERLAQDRVIYNDINLLNSFDMYPVELTSNREIASRITDYGKSKVKGPKLELDAPLVITDSATLLVKMVNVDGYFSNLLRAVVYDDASGDSVMALSEQYVTLATDEGKTKSFSLASDSLASGSYKVGVQYWNSLIEEWVSLDPLLLDPTISFTWHNPITSVPELNSAVACFVYPNPTTDFVYVQSQSNVESIRVFDMNGHLLSANAGENKMDLSHLAAGSYLLRIKTQTGETDRVVIRSR